MAGYRRLLAVVGVTAMVVGGMALGNATPARAAGVLLDPEGYGFSGLESLSLSTGQVAQFDTDTGAITGIRPAGNDVIDGIGVDVNSSGTQMTAFVFANLTVSAGAEITYVGRYGLALLSTGNVTVAGSVVADGAGFAGGTSTAGAQGPGAGNGGASGLQGAAGAAGGSYGDVGGRGGSASSLQGALPGAIYGNRDLSSTGPPLQGSGGGAGAACSGGLRATGASGGGALELVAMGTADVSGALLSAQGASPPHIQNSSGAGGGSGGAIMVVAPAYLDSGSTAYELLGGRGGDADPNSSCSAAGGGAGGGGRLTLITGGTSAAAIVTAVPPGGVGHLAGTGGSGSTPSVFTLPFVRLSAPTNALVGSEVVFGAAPARSPLAQVSSYLWNFGDGTAATTTDGSATHTYTAAGSYTVTVTATMSATGVTSAASASLAIGAVEHLQLNPATATIAPGESQPYAAEGFDAANTDLGDLTSASSFSIAPDGSCAGATCTASTSGPHTVTATYGSASGSADLDVSSPTLASISVTPAAPMVAVGTSQQLAATGHYSDGSTADITGQTAWSSSDEGVASIDASGLVSAVGRGDAAITASDGGVHGSATLHAADVPGAPTGVTATGGNGSATVSWSAPSDDGGSAITSYTATSIPDGTTATVDGSTTETTVTGLTNSVSYAFTVTATNDPGTGPPSDPSNPVTPHAPGPIVIGFKPGSGPVGTRTIIGGSGLAGATAVTFRGTAASFKVVSENRIRTRVPSGALTGKVTVTTPQGIASSPHAFKVRPEITGFTPTSGQPGTTVTISGTAFIRANAVNFGDLAAQFTVDSYSQITATVPAEATSGPITVITPGGSATSGDSFIVPLGTLTEYSVPTTNSWPNGIAVGSDGNMWFTEERAAAIARITPSGTITEYPLPSSDDDPRGITAGPDGNLWFTEPGASNVHGASAIGQITPSGTITEFWLPYSGYYAQDITSGPDGNLWFTVNVSGGAGEIGRMTTSGATTFFTAPTPNSLTSGIASGPDGNLWFTEANGNKIGRITPFGVITEFTVPTPGSGPVGIATGPDGSLWFTEAYADKIGQITPSGVITEFPVPAGDAEPWGIAAGPDGNLWFTEAGGNQVGRITPSGIIAELALPTANSAPRGITLGPDGNQWFTELNGNRIGEIVPRAGS